MSTDNQVKIDSLKAGMKKASTLIRSLNVVMDQAKNEKQDAETNWAKLHEELILLRTPWDYSSGIKTIQYRRSEGEWFETRDEFEIRFGLKYSFDQRNRNTHCVYLLRNPESGLLEADYSYMPLYCCKEDEDNILEYAKTVVLLFLDWFGHYPNPDDCGCNRWQYVFPVEYESWKDSYIF